MAEQLPPFSEFEQLEREISNDLLSNDGVYALVYEQLDPHKPAPEDLKTAFIARVYYGKPEVSDPNIDQSQFIPMALQIEAFDTSTVKRDSRTGIDANYFYINIGLIKNDSSQLYVYDQFGRLHQIERDKDGSFPLDPNSDQYDFRRAKAVAAWQSAHNRLLRASNENPAQYADPKTKTWTDRSRGSHEATDGDI